MSSTVSEKKGIILFDKFVSVAVLFISLLVNNHFRKMTTDQSGNILSTELFFLYCIKTVTYRSPGDIIHIPYHALSVAFGKLLFQLGWFINTLNVIITAFMSTLWFTSRWICAALTLHTTRNHMSWVYKPSGALSVNSFMLGILCNTRLKSMLVKNCFLTLLRIAWRLCRIVWKTKWASYKR